MAVSAVVAIAVSHMIWGAGILIQMTTHTCCCGVAIYAVLVAVLAFCHTVFPLKGIPGSTMIEPDGVPGPFAMALVTISAPKLVKVRVNMTLITVATDPFIFSFCLVAVYTEDVIMHPF